MTRHVRAELSSQDDSVRELRLSHESMSSTVDGVHRDMRAILGAPPSAARSLRRPADADLWLPLETRLASRLRQLASDVETLKVTAEGVREAQSRLDAFHRSRRPPEQADASSVLRAEVQMPRIDYNGRTPRAMPRAQSSPERSRRQKELLLQVAFLRRALRAAADAPQRKSGARDRGGRAR